jgi:CRP-like cAMP-binding protein
MAEPARESNVEHELIVRGLFGGQLRGALARQIVSVTREVHWPMGTMVFRYGDPSENIYVVVEGEVHLEAPDDKPWTFGRGGIFGIIDIELERPRSRTAIAKTDVRALIIRSEDWLDVMEDHMDLMRRRFAGNARDLFRRASALGPEGYPLPDSVPAMPTNGQLGRFERLVALRASPVFERAGVQALLRLAASARSMELAAGEVLFEEGDPVESIYLVASGEIAVSRKEPPFQAAFGPGALAGGPGQLVAPARPFGAVARAATVVIEIGESDFYEVLEDHFDVARAVGAWLALERERLYRMVSP